jgi:maltooligosyltrehalose trehalohydrolase
LVKVFCNLGNAFVECGNPKRVPLLLVSHNDVEWVEDKIVLPPNTLAILSAERV